MGEIFEEYSEKNRDELPPLMIIQGGGTLRRDESDRNLMYDRANLSNYKMVEEGDFIVHLRSFEGGLEMATNTGIISPAYHTLHGENTDSIFYYSYFRSKQFIDTDLKPHVYGIRDGRSIDITGMKTIKLPYTNFAEQKAIGDYISVIDSLITLHQRKSRKGKIMNIKNKEMFLHEYFIQWIKLFKDGAVRPITLEKYINNYKHLKEIVPNLRLEQVDRTTYQKILNEYAKTHERQTVIDFHHQIKSAVLDAVDDGLIDRDPTRKVIFKGKTPRTKKIKYLNQYELHSILSDLRLNNDISWDWLILLIAKTGLRFSEALGLTPMDFNFVQQNISITKTWDYKGSGGFLPTKNKSSMRKVQIDWQLSMQFQQLIKDLPEDKPIFVCGSVCNSTPNKWLERHCKNVGVPVISIHGLRHTHASLLMYAGVSLASVSRRLGHSSMTTTQKVYMHVIAELENQDTDIVMRYLSGLS